MKKFRQLKSVSIQDSRWLAYATAGIATSLVGGQSAHAEVHYSGVLTIPVRARSHEAPAIRQFRLNQSSASFSFVNRLHPPEGGLYGVAGFSIHAPVSAQFAGTFDQHYQVGYVSKLNSGDNISTRPFTPNRLHRGLYSTFSLGVLVNEYLYYHDQWPFHSTGFVGFKFDTGSGVQYGWARVRIPNKFWGLKGQFEVIDYAYADPGEPLAAGQKTSAPSQETIPQQGSIGLLALGGAGLLAWRRQRKVARSS